MEACACLCCHGFHAATLDPDRLAEMLRLHPRGLLAIRTGAPSGVVVIDVDPPGIGTMKILVSDGVLPRTLAAVTGRGGYHLLYGHPGGKIMSGAGKGGAGVDVKADGGYVVAPPSVHPATRRPYRWLSSPGDDLTPLPEFWAKRLRANSSPPGRPRQWPSRPAAAATRWPHCAGSSRRFCRPVKAPGTSRCTWPHGTWASWSPGECSRRTGPRPCCARPASGSASPRRGAPGSRVGVPGCRAVPEGRCGVTDDAAGKDPETGARRTKQGRASELGARCYVLGRTASGRPYAGRGDASFFLDSKGRAREDLRADLRDAWEA